MEYVGQHLHDPLTALLAGSDKGMQNTCGAALGPSGGSGVEENCEMPVQDAIKEKYVALLKAHIHEPTKKHLAAAADLGWKLIGADVPIEDVAQMHQEALIRVDKDIATVGAREVIDRAFGPLLEMLMAYSLAVRERAEEHKRAVRAEAQLKAAREIEPKNVELERLNKKLKETMADLLASQRRLLQSEKLAALGRLVAGVGHELNNPIMGILNYVQYCLERTDQDDPRYPRLAKAGGELERCARIVSNLLSYSHDSGDMDRPESEQAYCRTLITETVELLAAELRQLEIEITVDAPEDLPAIWTDTGALRQILLNLLTNARDALANGERKEITVTAKAQDGWIAISVADTGCGMSEEVLNRLFDPFFSTKAVGEGTGLGMSVSQNVARKLGAHIEVESQVDEGTVVTVHLPVDRRAVARTEQSTGTEG